MPCSALLGQITYYLNGFRNICLSILICKRHERGGSGLYIIMTTQIKNSDRGVLNNKGGGSGWEKRKRSLLIGLCFRKFVPFLVLV